MFQFQHGFPENFDSWSCSILYDGSDRMQYIGFINPSVYVGQFANNGAITETSQEAWAVLKLTYVGATSNIATLAWVRKANGKIKLDNPFDDPGSLTYT